METSHGVVSEQWRPPESRIYASINIKTSPMAANRPKRKSNAGEMKVSSTQPHAVGPLRQRYMRYLQALAVYRQAQDTALTTSKSIQAHTTDTRTVNHSLSRLGCTTMSIASLHRAHEASLKPLYMYDQRDASPSTAAPR